MSGTHYHNDQSLLRELMGTEADVAIELSKTATLERLMYYKYQNLQAITFAPFWDLSERSRSRVLNALITIKTSCMVDLRFYSRDEVDFVMKEFIKAYRDFFVISALPYEDLLHQLKWNYPEGLRWLMAVKASLAKKKSVSG